MKTFQILEICVCLQLTQHDPTHFLTFEILGFRAACLQMDLSRSSGGVAWPAGDHSILTSTRTFDLDGREHHGKPLDTISSTCSVFLYF